MVYALLQPKKCCNNRSIVNKIILKCLNFAEVDCLFFEKKQNLKLTDPLVEVLLKQMTSYCYDYLTECYFG